MSKDYRKTIWKNRISGLGSIFHDSEKAVNATRTVFDDTSLVDGKNFQKLRRKVYHVLILRKLDCTITWKTGDS